MDTAIACCGRHLIGHEVSGMSNFIRNSYEHLPAFGMLPYLPVVESLRERYGDENAEPDRLQLFVRLGQADKERGDADLYEAV